MNLHVKRMLDLNVKVGVRINKSFCSLICNAKRYGKMEFVEQDVINYVTKLRMAL